jgi:hypothetical protein
VLSAHDAGSLHRANPEQKKREHQRQHCQEGIAETLAEATQVCGPSLRPFNRPGVVSAMVPQPGHGTPRVAPRYVRSGSCVTSAVRRFGLTLGTDRAIDDRCGSGRATFVPMMESTDLGEMRRSCQLKTVGSSGDPDSVYFVTDVFCSDDNNEMHATRSSHHAFFYRAEFHIRNILCGGTGHECYGDSRAFNVITLSQKSRDAATPPESVRLSRRR